MKDLSKESGEFITQSIYFGDATQKSEGMLSNIWDKYLHLGSRIFKQSGEYIIGIGDNKQGLYFIKKGKVRLNLLGKDGAVKTISIKSERTIFAEQFIFHDQPGVIEAIVIEDCELYFFSREIIMTLMQKDFEVTMFIAKTQSIVARMMAYQIQDMAVRSVLQSLARILYSICCYEEKKGQKGQYVTMNLTHEEIANMLGAHRVTVTKNLNYLKTMGIIDYKYENISIKDRERLKEIASS